MCDEGRYGFHYVHDKARLVGARRREGERYENIEWSDVAAELPPRLRAAGRLAAVLSPHLTVEEAYLLAKLVRGADPQALLAVGPAPQRGEDERFRNGFTIRAEKCPNRRGVEQIVRHFMGEELGFEDLLLRLDSAHVRGLWVTAGYPEAWIDERTAARLREMELLIVQDLFTSPLWELADYQLPGTAFPEREGSYVNHDERLQTVDWAIRPPGGARAEGSLYWRLLGMTGLYQAPSVLQEIAATVPYFAPAASGVPETGVDLLSAAAR
jgi:NADH-quinone oxidoreductase subunit G